MTYYCEGDTLLSTEDTYIVSIEKRYKMRFVNTSEMLMLVEEYTKNNTLCPAVAEDIGVSDLYPILDTETTGIDFKNDHVIMLQLGDINNQFLIDTRAVDIRLFKTSLERVHWNGTNLQFDYNMLKKYGIVLKIHQDTMLNDMILDAGLLNPVTRREFKNYTGYGYFTMAGSYYRYFDKRLDKDTTTTFLNIGKKPYTRQHIGYCIQDIIAPNEILIKQNEELEKNSYKNKFILDGDEYNLASMEAEVSLGLGDMAYNGMPINTSMWLSLGSVFKKEVIEYRNKLNEIVKKDNLAKNLQTTLFDGDVLNWDSPKQLIKFLSSIKGINLKDPNTKKISTSVGTLKQNENVHRIIPVLLDYRKKKKQVSTYGKEFVNKYVKNNRVHTSFYQIVATGRTSSFKPNLQNIPAAKEVRDCFAVSKDRKMINCDYSGQESVITANKCKDPKLIDFYLNGDGDLHSLVANNLFEIIENKPQNISKSNPGYSETFKKKKRNIAKTLNFKLDYGGSVSTVATSFDITEALATKLYKAVLEVFPEKIKYFNNVAVKSIKDGYITINNVTHRKRKLPEYDKFKELFDKVVDKIGRNTIAYLIKSLLHNDKIDFRKYRIHKKTLSSFIKLYSKYKRLSMNTPTQGTAGDMTKIAILLLRKRLIARGISPLNNDIMLIGQVHDEILVSVVNKEAEYVSELVKSAMEDAGKLFCDIVPMKAEPVVQQVWGH